MIVLPFKAVFMYIHVLIFYFLKIKLPLCLMRVCHSALK